MLALFRRKKQSLKWTLWVVIVVLGGGMVFLFVDIPTGISGGVGDWVARVDGRQISPLTLRRHYQQLYDVFREIYKLDEQDPKVVRQLRLGDRARDQLISQYVILVEAERMGVGATDEEVRERIESSPSFRENGKFMGFRRYQRILDSNNYTPQEFEDSIRRNIVRERLQNILTDGIIVTPEEVRQEFLDRNQEVKLRYVVIDPKKTNPPPAPQKELREYFEKNKESYRVGEQRKVRYLTVALDPNTVEVTQEQIEARMETLQEKVQVRASHIFIRVNQEVDEVEARKKARKLLDRVRSGEDFAEVAKEHSQDHTSAALGGDMGFLGRGQNPPELENVIFSLDTGEISDLVRSPFGFHIIKVTDVPRPAQARRSQAEFQLRREEAAKAARDLANQIANQARKTSNLQAVAREHDFSAKETPFFGRGDPVPRLMVRSDFNQRIFALKEKEIADPYQAGGFIVAQLAGIKPPELPNFNKIRDQLEKDFSAQRAEERARESAYDFYQVVKDTRFEQKAREQGLAVTTTSFFKKGANIDEALRFSTELQDRAFRMKVGETSSPLQIAGNYVVFQVVEKSDLDESKFEQEKKQIVKELRANKGNDVFSAYIRNLVIRLREEERIEVNQPLIDRITG